MNCSGWDQLNLLATIPIPQVAEPISITSHQLNDVLECHGKIRFRVKYFKKNSLNKNLNYNPNGGQGSTVRAMWPAARNIRTPSYELLSEIAVRVLLLLAVYVMQCHLEPRNHYITEAELLSIYKRPRRDSFVPPWATICVIIIIPLIFFSVPLVLTRNYEEFTQAFLAWTLGLSVNAVITEMIKLTVGRPRPDFFYRCFPNGKINKELQCTGDARDVIEGRKSFPSGHSSFSFCSLGFLSLWLCGRLGILSRNRGNGARVVTCLLPLLLASIVAVSRCCDNHHHWEDVLVGSLIGFITAYLSYNRYYNALNSELSGCPNILVEHPFYESNSEFECSSRDLNDCMILCNKEKYGIST